MKKILLIVLIALSVPAPSTLAWNLKAMHVNALIFARNGAISFSLFDQERSGAEFTCSPDNVWFTIRACPGSDAACIAGVNRMASMLLAAKLSGKMVHVERDGCEVIEIALKP